MAEELPVSVQTDKAFSLLTKTMAHTAPKHLHNANQAVKAMRRRRGR